MNENVEVKTVMLIRKPAAQVFEAFVDPAVTAKFWFTKGSGRLKQGERATWEWEMYKFKADVQVVALEPGKRIAIEWGAPATKVEWRFTERADRTTLVEITNRGFEGDDDAIVAKALDSMGGFSFLLAGAKAWLEHGVELNLTADHHPA
jgi:uncharacterized protein YndB with AHSA1/START domain